MLQWFDLDTIYNLFSYKRVKMFFCPSNLLNKIPRISLKLLAKLNYGTFSVNLPNPDITQADIDAAIVAINASKKHKTTEETQEALKHLIYSLTREGFVYRMQLYYSVIGYKITIQYTLIIYHMSQNSI